MNDHDKMIFLYSHMVFQIWTCSVSDLAVIHPAARGPLNPGLGSLITGRLWCHRMGTHARGDRRGPSPLTLSLYPRAVSALVGDWCRSKSNGKLPPMDSENGWESLVETLLKQTAGPAPDPGRSHSAGSGLGPEILHLRFPADADVLGTPSEMVREHHLIYTWSDKHLP